MPDLHPDQAITQAFIRIAKSASGNKVGALLDAAAAFRTGSIAEKLESLSDMKSLDNSSITDGLQAVQLRQLKYGNATILAEHGPLPVHIMGQQKTLADLNTAFADELQRVYLSAVLAKLVQAGEPFAFSNFSSFVRYTHLSAADTLQQRGACQLYLGKPAEAVADLTAALQQGNPSWLTYHYRAAAHEALGNDKAAAEDKAEESRIAPDPDFVTLAFPLESHDFEMMEVHGQQNWLSLRERQYMLAVAELDLAGKQKQLTACGLIKRGCYKHLQGDAEGADADFELAVAHICMQHSPSAAMRFAQAVMCLAKANLSAALKHLEEAHAQEPGIHDILHLRGLVKHLLGDHWGAIMDLDGRAHSKRSLWKLASAKLWLGFQDSGMMNIIAAHSLAVSKTKPS